jgi:hypothetical protein
MTEKNETKPSELSFEEEVDRFLTMDPEERSRQAERLMAERIVYLRRKARGEPVPDDS